MAEANQPYLEDETSNHPDEPGIPDLDNDSLALPDDNDEILEDSLPGSEPDVLDDDLDLDDDDDVLEDRDTGIGLIDDLNLGDTDSDNETGAMTPAL